MSFHHWRHGWAGAIDGNNESEPKAIGKMTKAELVAHAADLGIELRGDETKAEIQGAIADGANE